MVSGEKGESYGEKFNKKGLTLGAPSSNQSQRNGKDTGKKRFRMVFTTGLDLRTKPDKQRRKGGAWKERPHTKGYHLSVQMHEAEMQGVGSSNVLAIVLDL